MWKVLEIAEKYALQLDNQRQALTLRLRELGGLIRIAGDLAVQEDESIVTPNHISKAKSLSKGIDSNTYRQLTSPRADTSQTYGDYFF